MPSNRRGVKVTPRLPTGPGPGSRSGEHVGAIRTAFVLPREPLLYVSTGRRRNTWPEMEAVGLCVEEKRVMDRAVLTTHFVVATCAPLYDLASEVLRAEHCIEDDLQVMAGGWVAMQV